MRESFPHKDAGDSLSAQHINKLGSVGARVSRFQGGAHVHVRHTESVLGVAIPPPFVQVLLEVSSVTDRAKGLFKGRRRYYSDGDEEWYTASEDDDGEWPIDCQGLDVLVSVGRLVVAYWDSQRGAFVPILPPCNPLVDYSGSGGTLPSTERGDWTVDFELEMSSDGGTNWQVVNGRVYSISVNVEQEEGSSNPRVSGCGIYTFLVTTLAYLRVRARTNVKTSEATISVGDAALRLEAKCQDGVQHLTSTPFTSGLTVPLWITQAAVNNDGPDDGMPGFSAYGTALVRTPAGESWTIEAELCLTCEVEESQSSTSPSSMSDTSSSSTSTSTAASETSSSTSVSATSQSSTSSGTFSESTPSSCSSGPCYYCEDGTAPNTMYVQLSGVALKYPEVCSDCLNWNNTDWELSRTPEDPCEWKLTEGLPCDGTLLFFGVQQSGSDLVVTLSVTVNGVHVGQFERTYEDTSEIDCSTITLPTWGDSATPDSRCDWTGASALVTSR